MKSKDLLDAIGQLPQDLLEEGLPTRVGMPAEEESEAGEREMKMTKQPEQKRKIRLRMGAAVAAVCVLEAVSVLAGAAPPSPQPASVPTVIIDTRPKDRSFLMFCIFLSSPHLKMS